LRQSVVKEIPFLEYAVFGVLYHANLAARGGIPQAQFLEDFRLQVWIRLSNILQRYKVRRHTENVSCLYILAENNFANLVKALPVLEPCTEIEGERYGCSLSAALATESADVIDIFFERTSIKQNLLNGLALGKGNYGYKMPSHHNGRTFTYSKKKGILSSAAELHDEKIFVIAALSPHWLGADSEIGKSTLSIAINYGYGVTVGHLVEAYPTLTERPDKEGKRPLQRASLLGRETIVRILLEREAKVNALDRRDRSALSIACAAGHEKIAVILLEKGADVNASDGIYGSALAAACATGHEKVAIMLLEKDADVNAPAGSDGSVLAAACVQGLEKVAMMLLEKGADVNAPVGPGGSALAAACAKGLEKVAVMLIEKGAGVNASPDLCASTLHAVAHEGSPEVVERLIKAHEKHIPPSPLNSYQIQLILLEQQNKTRLLIARQEQDGISSHHGIPTHNRSID
jgi:ankyrin repeat protein